MAAVSSAKLTCVACLCLGPQSFFGLCVRCVRAKTDSSVSVVLSGPLVQIVECFFLR